MKVIKKEQDPKPFKVFFQLNQPNDVHLTPWIHLRCWYNGNVTGEVMEASLGGGKTEYNFSMPYSTSRWKISELKDTNCIHKMLTEYVGVAKEAFEERGIEININPSMIERCIII